MYTIDIFKLLLLMFLLGLIGQKWICDIGILTINSTQVWAYIARARAHKSSL